jgi:hypothetical protein
LIGGGRADPRLWFNPIPTLQEMKMRKLKLNLDALSVESFEPSKEREDAGTVRGYLSAYYELCNVDDTWQQTCTCEPTCNADTCFNCGGGGGTGGCTVTCPQLSDTCPSPGYCG